MSDLDLNLLKVIELRHELSTRGLDTKGGKPILVQRLQDAINRATKETKRSTASQQPSTKGEEASFKSKRQRQHETWHAETKVEVGVISVGAKNGVNLSTENQKRNTRSVRFGNEGVPPIPKLVLSRTFKGSSSHPESSQMQNAYTAKAVVGTDTSQSPIKYESEEQKKKTSTVGEVPSKVSTRNRRSLTSVSDAVSEPESPKRITRVGKSTASDELPRGSRRSSSSQRSSLSKPFDSSSLKSEIEKEIESVTKALVNEKPQSRRGLSLKASDSSASKTGPDKQENRTRTRSAETVVSERPVGRRNVPSKAPPEQKSDSKKKQEVATEHVISKRSLNRGNVSSRIVSTSSKIPEPASQKRKTRASDPTTNIAPPTRRRSASSAQKRTEDEKKTPVAETDLGKESSNRRSASSKTTNKDPSKLETRGQKKSPAAEAVVSESTSDVRTRRSSNKNAETKSPKYEPESKRRKIDATDPVSLGSPVKVISSSKLPLLTQRRPESRKRKNSSVGLSSADAVAPSTRRRSTSKVLDVSSPPAPASKRRKMLVVKKISAVNISLRKQVPKDQNKKTQAAKSSVNRKVASSAVVSKPPRTIALAASIQKSPAKKTRITASAKNSKPDKNVTERVNKQQPLPVDSSSGSTRRSRRSGVNSEAQSKMVVKDSGSSKLASEPAQVLQGALGNIKDDTLKKPDDMQVTDSSETTIKKAVSLEVSDVCVKESGNKVVYVKDTHEEKVSKNDKTVASVTHQERHEITKTELEKTVESKDVTLEVAVTEIPVRQTEQVLEKKADVKTPRVGDHDVNKQNTTQELGGKAVISDNLEISVALKSVEGLQKSPTKVVMESKKLETEVKMLSVGDLGKVNSQVPIPVFLEASDPFSHLSKEKLIAGSEKKYIGLNVEKSDSKSKVQGLEKVSEMRLQGTGLQKSDLTEKLLEKDIKGKNAENLEKSVPQTNVQMKQKQLSDISLNQQPIVEGTKIADSCQQKGQEKPLQELKKSSVEVDEKISPSKPADQTRKLFEKFSDTHVRKTAVELPGKTVEKVQESLSPAKSSDNTFVKTTVLDISPKVIPKTSEKSPAAGIHSSILKSNQQELERSPSMKMTDSISIQKSSDKIPFPKTASDYSPKAKESISGKTSCEPVKTPVKPAKADNFASLKTFTQVPVRTVEITKALTPITSENVEATKKIPPKVAQPVTAASKLSLPEESKSRSVADEHGKDASAKLPDATLKATSESSKIAPLVKTPTKAISQVSDEKTFGTKLPASNISPKTSVSFSEKMSSAGSYTSLSRFARFEESKSIDTKKLEKEVKELSSSHDSKADMKRSLDVPSTKSEDSHAVSKVPVQSQEKTPPVQVTDSSVPQPPKATVQEIGKAPVVLPSDTHLNKPHMLDKSKSKDTPQKNLGTVSQQQHARMESSKSTVQVPEKNSDSFGITKSIKAVDSHALQKSSGEIHPSPYTSTTSTAGIPSKPLVSKTAQSFGLPKLSPVKSDDSHMQQQKIAGSPVSSVKPADTHDPSRAMSNQSAPLKTSPVKAAESYITPDKSSLKKPDSLSHSLKSTDSQSSLQTLPIKSTGAFAESKTTPAATTVGLTTPKAQPVKSGDSHIQPQKFTGTHDSPKITPAKSVDSSVIPVKSAETIATQKTSPIKDTVSQSSPKISPSKASGNFPPLKPAVVSDHVKASPVASVGSHDLPVKSNESSVPPKEPLMKGIVSQPSSKTPTAKTSDSHPAPLKPLGSVKASPATPVVSQALSVKSTESRVPPKEQPLAKGIGSQPSPKISPSKTSDSHPSPLKPVVAPDPVKVSPIMPVGPVKSAESNVPPKELPMKGIVTQPFPKILPSKISDSHPSPLKPVDTHHLAKASPVVSAGSHAHPVRSAELSVPPKATPMKDIVGQPTQKISPSKTSESHASPSKPADLHDPVKPSPILSAGSHALPAKSAEPKATPTPSKDIVSQPSPKILPAKTSDIHASALKSAVAHDSVKASPIISAGGHALPSKCTDTSIPLNATPMKDAVNQPATKISPAKTSHPSSLKPVDTHYPVKASPITSSAGSHTLPAKSADPKILPAKTTDYHASPLKTTSSHVPLKTSPVTSADIHTHPVKSTGSSVSSKVSPVKDIVSQTATKTLPAIDSHAFPLKVTGSHDLLNTSPVIPTDSLVHHVKSDESVIPSKLPPMKNVSPAAPKTLPAKISGGHASPLKSTPSKALDSHSLLKESAKALEKIPSVKTTETSILKTESSYGQSSKVSMQEESKKKDESKSVDEKSGKTSSLFNLNLTQVEAKNKEITEKDVAKEKTVTKIERTPKVVQESDKSVQDSAKPAIQTPVKTPTTKGDTRPPLKTADTKGMSNYFQLSSMFARFGETKKDIPKKNNENKTTSEGAAKTSVEIKNSGVKPGPLAISKTPVQGHESKPLEKTHDLPTGSASGVSTKLPDNHMKIGAEKPKTSPTSATSGGYAELSKFAMFGESRNKDTPVKNKETEKSGKLGENLQETKTCGSVEKIEPKTGGSGKGNEVPAKDSAKVNVETPVKTGSATSENKSLDCRNKPATSSPPSMQAKDVRLPSLEKTKAETVEQQTAIKKCEKVQETAGVQGSNMGLGSKAVSHDTYRTEPMPATQVPISERKECSDNAAIKSSVSPGKKSNDKQEAPKEPLDIKKSSSGIMAQEHKDSIGRTPECVSSSNASKVEPGKDVDKTHTGNGSASIIPMSNNTQKNIQDVKPPNVSPHKTDSSMHNHDKVSLTTPSVNTVRLNSDKEEKSMTAVGAAPAPKLPASTPSVPLTKTLFTAVAEARNEAAKSSAENVSPSTEETRGVKRKFSEETSSSPAVPSEGVGDHAEKVMKTSAEVPVVTKMQ